MISVTQNILEESDVLYKIGFCPFLKQGNFIHVGHSILRNVIGLHSDGYQLCSSSRRLVHLLRGTHHTEASQEK
jgi:hypothetical protein